MNRDLPLTETLTKAHSTPAAIPPGWTQTYTGRRFYPLAPKVADIEIEDIAHQLAAENRYSGATAVPYSVAQHSVLVAEKCPVHLKMEGLLHDASEAYLRDLPRPLKSLPAFQDYRQFEGQLEQKIAQRFQLQYPWDPIIHAIDRRVALTEGHSHNLFPGGLLPGFFDDAFNGDERYAERVDPWDHRRAELEFLRAFQEYRQARQFRDVLRMFRP
jgi:hypothetical protein